MKESRSNRVLTKTEIRVLNSMQCRDYQEVVTITKISGRIVSGLLITVERLKNIPGVVCSPPKGGFCVFPDFSSSEPSSQALSKEVLKGRIALGPGSSWDRSEKERQGLCCG